MELRQLHYFRQVARSGSFSQAAAVLAVAQPALSRQVRKLEEELGVALLYRHGRGVMVTQAGDHFLAELENALRSLDRGRDLVCRGKHVPEGRVSLAMPPSLNQVLAAPLLQRLRTTWPELRLHVVDAFSGFINEWLLSGRVDLAVLHGAQHAASILAEPLLSEDLHLIVAPDAPQTGTELPFGGLEGLPLILPGQHHGLRRALDRVAAEVGLPLQVAMEVDALTAIKQLVAGGSCSVLPFSAVQEEVAQGRLRALRLVQPAARNELVLGMSARRPVTLAMREVVRALRAELRERGGESRLQLAFDGDGLPADAAPA